MPRSLPQTALNPKPLKAEIMNQWKHIALTVAFALAAFALGAVLDGQFVSPRQNPLWMYAIGICTFVLAILTAEFLNPGMTYTRERKLLAEIDRLRAGLKFYAQAENLILHEWEDSGEPGWWCPPYQLVAMFDAGDELKPELRNALGQALTERLETMADKPDWNDSREIDLLIEVFAKVMLAHGQEGIPWMVEDGGVARIILRGGRIVGKEHDELIAQMDPAPRRIENGVTLVPCFAFDFGDRPLILRQTDGVQHLVDVIGEGPHTLTVSKLELTKRQLRELPEWG